MASAARVLDVAAPVIANRPLSDDYNVLALAAPAIAAAAAPGQFVMVKAGNRPRPAAAPAVLGVRNPARRERRATRHLASSASASARRRGCSTTRGRATRSTCLGPLGRPFTDRRPAGRSLDGGRRRRAGAVRDAGADAARARRGRHAVLRRAPRRTNCSISISSATSASSSSSRPRTAAPASAAASIAPLDRRSPPAAPSAPVMIYACGPEGMLAATARVGERHGRPCQVSVERIMGCGLGGCYSCVVPMRGDEGGSPRAVVHHGPVVPGRSDPVLDQDRTRVAVWTDELRMLRPWICRFASAR